MAQKAADLGEVPVGAVVALDGAIIAEAYNTKETALCATGHAEINAIQKACSNLGRWRLTDCELYVTLEPCLMCAGAIIQARFKRVIMGALDPKGGAVKSLFQVLQDDRLNHRPEVASGVLAEECAQILKDFFKARRQADEDKP